MDAERSVSHIRRRLFFLLLQAFGVVLLLTVVLLVGLSGWTLLIARSTPPIEPFLTSILEVYYLAHGSWEGVDTVFENEPSSTLSFFNLREDAILLDETGRVLVDHGRTDTALVGQVYESQKSDVSIPLNVAETRIGTVVYTRRPTLVDALPPALPFLGPLAGISFATGLLALLIGLLLMRRLVAPLADVIAAAQSVAAGKLSTRVQARGPGDLRALSDSFNDMAGALERNDRERRDFLADIAHELRTPITVIRGRLEGIVDGIYPGDGDHVAPALEETYLLERLVEDLRLLTLAESRQLPLERRPVHLGELAGRAVELFAAEAGESGIALTVQAESGLPTTLADAQRVEQVIGNLVSNALCYARPGTGEGRVTIAVRRTAEGVELSVGDNGPGVPEADLPRIFDRFWRGERSRARAAGGAGLGLAIARQLVEAQGGVVFARNQPEGGLQVGFTLKTIDA